MASTPVTWTPSGTETTSGVVPLGGAVVLSLPAVDGANPDLLVSNAGPSAIWLSFGAGAAVSPGAAGMVRVPGVGSVLLTSVAQVIAAAAAVGDPNVITGAQATAAATSTAVSALAQNYGGTLTFTRGVATAALVI